MIIESCLIDDLLNLEEAIKFIKEKLDRNRAKIFAFEDQISKKFIGFVILMAKVNPLSRIKYDWHISYLYVNQEFRRKKTAQQLLLKCIDYAHYTKVEFITLNTNKDNIPAQKLYESLNFIRKDFLVNYIYYEIAINKFQ